MSVINQMLKDLDQRSPEANTPAMQAANGTSAPSASKIALITTACVVTICFVGFYVWQLTNENNALKAEQSHYKSAVNQTNQAKQVNTMVAVAKPELAKEPSTEMKAVLSTNTGLAAWINKADNTVSNPSQSQPSNNQESQQSYTQGQQEHQEQQAIAVPTSLPSSTVDQSSKAPANKVAVNSGAQVRGKSIITSNLSQVTPATKTKDIATEQDSAHGHPHPHTPPELQHASAAKAKEKPKAKAQVKAKPLVNKMSVSRRQLSADELAQQKLAQAEKALAANQVSKAEKLLEDVVLLTPSDSQTRKKLAALWFGRHAYQDAVNLLSQGIALNSKDSSLREMKARIHLQQGQVTAALNTLKPLAQLKDEQYQIMLANTAQQAQQNKIAVGAYQVLIAMQPDKGRWQLGLAVLYDKNSQFTLASKAYKTALTKSDLSISSEDFVKQRIQVIGQ